MKPNHKKSICAFGHNPESNLAVLLTNIESNLLFSVTRDLAFTLHMK